MAKRTASDLATVPCLRAVGPRTVAVVLGVALGAGCETSPIVARPERSAAVAESAPAATIEIDQPARGATVASPLRVTGLARGPWYFEGQFNVALVADGREIAAAAATAEGEWTTQSWVPFTATLEFDAAAPARATLVLEAANPSGLAANARSHRVPVQLAP